MCLCGISKAVIEGLIPKCILFKSLCYFWQFFSNANIFCYSIRCLDMSCPKLMLFCLGAFHKPMFSSGRLFILLYSLPNMGKGHCYPLSCFILCCEVQIVLTVCPGLLCTLYYQGSHPKWVCIPFTLYVHYKVSHPKVTL